MDLFIHLGMSIALLMIFFLFKKRKKHRADYFLLAWIIGHFCLLVFYELTIYRQPLYGLPAIIGFSIVLLNLPLLYFYIRSLIGQPPGRWEILGHFSPFVWYCLWLAGLHYYGGIPIEAHNGYIQLPQNSPAWFTWYPIPLAISGGVYSIWNLFLLSAHRKQLSGFFSNHETINLDWIRYLIYGTFLITIVVMFLIFSATSFGLIHIEVVFSFVAVCISALIFASGFFGLQQVDIFTNTHYEAYTATPSSSKSAYQKSGLSDEKARIYAQQLRAQIVGEKLYLDEQLTLASLAQQVELSPAHLSQVINQQIGQHFYDFINEYRVKEAQQRLVNPKYSHYTIMGIALDCGFKSKSSFNRAFKKIVGLTPTQFSKQNRSL